MIGAGWANGRVSRTLGFPYFRNVVTNVITEVNVHKNKKHASLRKYFNDCHIHTVIPLFTSQIILNNKVVLFILS